MKEAQGWPKNEAKAFLISRFGKNESMSFQREPPKPLIHYEIHAPELQARASRIFVASGGGRNNAL